MEASAFRRRFTELLQEALSDPEVIETLGDAKLQPEPVRADVEVNRFEAVEEELAVWIEAVRDADARLEKAQLELAELKLPFWPQFAFGAGLLLAAGMVGCVVLAFVSSFWWLYGLFFFGLPWAL